MRYLLEPLRSESAGVKELIQLVYPRDVWTAGFPEVDWRDARVSLDQLYRYLVHHAESNIHWYLRRKSVKRRWAVTLRLAAIVMGTMAAVIPAVVGIVPVGKLTGNWAPLSSVFVALSAGSIGLDKFFGFSSAWMRYMTTELDLQARLKTFQLGWLQERLRWWEKPLSQEKTLELLQMLEAFTRDVDGLVANETRMWIDEFRGNLASLERVTAPAPAATSQAVDRTATGALKIRFDGVDPADPHHWTVKAGEAAPAEHRGAAMVITDLRCGLLKVRIQGRRHGDLFQLEDVVHIRAGEITELVVRTA